MDLSELREHALQRAEKVSTVQPSSEYGPRLTTCGRVIQRSRTVMISLKKELSTVIQANTASLTQVHGDP